MKIHLIFITLILGGEWAHGTVQNSLNQDKPPYISVQNYNITLNGQSTASYLGGLKEFEQWGGSLAGGSTSGGGSLAWQYNDNLYCQYGSGLNYSWSWTDLDYYIQTFSYWDASSSLENISTNSGSLCIPKLVCDYYYFYTNGFVPNYGSYYFTLEESTTAHTTMILHTGGKPTSRLRNIIALNGWGASQMVPSIYLNIIQSGAGIWCGYYGGGTNFPAQNVSLGSLGVCASDANGNKYVALPDNATVDVTPKVAGVPRYVFNIGPVLKYTLTIAARGNGTNYNLSTNTPEFCAGQLLTFTPSWSPSTPSYVNSVQHWTLPDKYVNQPTNYSATCATYVNNTDLLTNLVNQCWYVNGSGGTASIGMNLKFANGQYASVAAMGDFTIYRPTATIEVTHPGNVDLDGNFYLEDAPVDFYGHVQSAYHGAANWTQLVNRDCQQAFYIETGTWGNYWLDTSLFYSNQTNKTVGPGLKNPVPLEDAPEVLIDVHVSNIDKFKTYLMFRPDGDGSIYVPLGRTDWGWHGDAFPGLLQDGGITAPQFNETDEFPVWPNVFVSSEQ